LNSENIALNFTKTGYRGRGEIWLQCVHPELVDSACLGYPDNDRPNVHPTSHPNTLHYQSSPTKDNSGIAKYLINLRGDEEKVEFPALFLRRARTADFSTNIRNRQKAYSTPNLNQLEPMFFKGADHSKEINRSSTDACRIRICFQVFLADQNDVLHEVSRTFSSVVEDSSVYRKPEITKIFDKSSPKNGNKKITLLCDGIRSNHKIQIRFTYETAEDKEHTKYWPIDGVGRRQASISFKTPPYASFQGCIRPNVSTLVCGNIRLIYAPIELISVSCVIYVHLVILRNSIEHM
jgi:hypothetical protein